MMHVFLLSILVAISNASWKSHCDAMQVSSGDSFLGCMIVVQSNGAVATKTGMMSLDKFTDWPAVQKSVLQKNHRSAMFDGAKFLNVQQTNDFSVFTYSGNYQGIQKPIMVIAPSKMMMIVGLFSKRDANVDNVCKVAQNLKNANTLLLQSAKPESQAEMSTTEAMEWGGIYAMTAMTIGMLLGIVCTISVYRNCKRDVNNPELQASWVKLDKNPAVAQI